MGLKADISSEKEVLRELQSDFERIKSKNSEEERKSTENRKSWDGTLQALHSSQDESFQTLLSESRAKLADLEDLYANKLHLEAPVTYWSRKADRHRNFAAAFGVVFLLLASGLVFAMFKFDDNLQPFVDAAADKPIVAIVFLGIPVFVAVWVLRFVARLFLQNIALNNDGRERAAMTETFLALMKDEEAKMTEADRILILQALFRPSAVSHPSDDGAPPNWFDVLMSRIDPKR